MSEGLNDQQVENLRWGIAWAIWKALNGLADELSPNGEDGNVMEIGLTGPGQQGLHVLIRLAWRLERSSLSELWDEFYIPEEVFEALRAETAEADSEHAALLSEDKLL